MNKSEDLSSIHQDIDKKEQKKELDAYFNFSNNKSNRQNYSMSSVANIKLKRIILPEYLNKRKINQTSNNLLWEKKGAMLKSDN